jgi:acyl carrier protein
VNTELKHIVAEALELPVSELVASSQAADFQEWDSLGHWSMIAAVEDHYGIEFSMQEAEQFETLGCIEKLLSDKGVLK